MRTVQTQTEQEREVHPDNYRLEKHHISVAFQLSASHKDALSTVQRLSGHQVTSHCYVKLAATVQFLRRQVNDGVSRVSTIFL